jgi:hypothetical protein
LVSSIAFAADDSRAWIESVADPLNNTLRIVDTASHDIVKSIPLLTSFTSNVVSTPPGAATCDYRMNTLQSSWSVNAGTAMLSLRTSCPWVASSDSPWARIDKTSGTGSAEITLTVDQNFTTTNRSGTITIGGQLVIVTQASFSATPPFGYVDTPADGATGISGALSLTGWALDDVGVTQVRVVRDPVASEPAAPVFIGNATFVEGARPDVQSAFPGYPNASRAGWGLQILTNMLPNAGTGTYRLSVFADDVDGHTTLLGTRSVTCTNTTAVLPFGTIDTPGPGEVVSGSAYVNFGWALAPQPKLIPLDGSTIDVLVDGLLVGHPTYGFPRADIDALFPAYENTGHGVGFFILDTTTLANGLHTIAWIVHDNTGATQGIGSRFFTVANP